MALCIVGAPLAAQDKCGPDELVPWWPRSFSPYKEYTPAERAIMDANLSAAEELVRKTKLRDAARIRCPACVEPWGTDKRRAYLGTWQPDSQSDSCVRVRDARVSCVLQIR